MKFKTWLESTQHDIQYTWTRQVANWHASGEWGRFGTFAANNMRKPVIGMLLVELPDGLIHKIQQVVRLPNGVTIHDGWNGSFHAATYSPPALAAVGRHHKDVRNKLLQAYDMVMQASRQVQIPDLAAQRMYHKSLLRPGD